MANRNQPLNIRTAIVNEDGTPNQYFLRWMQDQGVDIDAKLDPDSINTYIQAWAATRSINAGTGLSGGGNLSADRTLNLNAGIDLLTDVDTTTTPPTDGQALIWKAADSLWKPGSVASGGGSGGSGALTFISQQTLGAAAASVTFSTIPQTYEDLILVVDAGSVLNNGTTTAVLGLQFNGDTGNNYMFTMLGTYGAGTGFSNNSAATNSMGVGLDNSSGTAGVPFSFNHIEIANYTSATRKSAIGQFSGYQGNVGILQGTASGNWTGTAAITSLTIVDRNGNNFAAGSKFTLYARVKNGDSGNDPTLYLIHDQTLVSNAATYDVTNIPQTYEDLVIMVESRQDTGGLIEGYVRPNNDTGANYDGYAENRFGTTTQTDKARIFASEQSTATAGLYAVSEATIFGYSKTNRFKTWLSKAAWITDNFEDRGSGTWKSNAAITSLRFFPGANNFVAGTRIRVYGRKPSVTPLTQQALYTDKQSLNGVNSKTIIVPPGYTNLRLVLTGAVSTAVLQEICKVTVNGLSTGIYSTGRNYFFGGSSAANQELSQTFWGTRLMSLPGTGAPANSSGFIDIELYDYAGTTFRKTGKFHGRQPFSAGSPDAYGGWGVLEANLTSAITSITVATSSGNNFANGSIAELILTP